MGVHSRGLHFQQQSCSQRLNSSTQQAALPSVCVCFGSRTCQLEVKLVLAAVSQDIGKPALDFLCSGMVLCLFLSLASAAGWVVMTDESLPISSYSPPQVSADSHARPSSNHPPGIKATLTNPTAFLDSNARTFK